MKQPYQPHPEDTSAIELPAELAALQEKMARHVHETWAEGRLSQGWTYGPERSDLLRQHPMLIPYDELPEEEKDYDRRTALETLRLIMKCGYRITR